MRVCGEDIQPRFLLVGNGAYENRGCEAIARGTARILRATFGPCRILNWYFDPRPTPPPVQEPDPSLLHIPMRLPKRLSPAWMAVRCLQHVHHPTLARIAFGDLLLHARSCNAILAVGGDNFTLDYGKPAIFIALANALSRVRRPQVLWGASVGPFDRTPAYQRFVAEVLRKRFSRLFVREEISASYLDSGLGLGHQVWRASDPAFLLEPDHSQFTPPPAAIGVNLSPLLQARMEKQGPGRWRRFLGEFAGKLALLSRPIVMIPHVTAPCGDDSKCLREFSDFLSLRGVQALFPPTATNAAQAKAIIAGLDALVAARTHACIAGYSTQVPVLAIGYSPKASGIAESIFGNPDLTVRADEVDADGLFQKLTAMLRGAEGLRAILRRQRHALIHSSLRAGEGLRDLLRL